MRTSETGRESLDSGWQCLPGPLKDHPSWVPGELVADGSGDDIPSLEMAPTREHCLDQGYAPLLVAGHIQ